MSGHGSLGKLHFGFRRALDASHHDESAGEQRAWSEYLEATRAWRTQNTFGTERVARRLGELRRAAGRAALGHGREGS